MKTPDGSDVPTCVRESQVRQFSLLFFFSGVPMFSFSDELPISPMLLPPLPHISSEEEKEKKLCHQNKTPEKQNKATPFK